MRHSLKKKLIFLKCGTAGKKCVVGRLADYIPGETLLHIDYTSLRLQKVLLNHACKSALCLRYHWFLSGEIDQHGRIVPRCQEACRVAGCHTMLLSTMYFYQFMEPSNDQMHLFASSLT